MVEGHKLGLGTHHIGDTGSMSPHTDDAATSYTYCCDDWLRGTDSASGASTLASR